MGENEYYNIRLAIIFERQTPYDMTTNLLPSNAKDWAKTAKACGIRVEEYLAKGDSFQSGSRFSSTDFLRLRILHVQHQTTNLLPHHHENCLPKALITSVKAKFDTSCEFQALRHLVTPENIESWTVEDSRKAPQFAVGLEHLHLIIRKQKENSGSSEDRAPPKIFPSSPRKTRSMTKAVDVQSSTDISTHLSNLKLDPIHHSGVTPQTPIQNPKSISKYDLDDYLIPPSSIASTMPPELQRIVDEYKQAMFEMGDEQTVNACLVALIMPVAWILGRSGCVHLDRKPLQLRRGDGEILYEARVDGIITESTKDGNLVKSIMEVKRGLRGGKTDVRMQEGAQMAAFIYSDKNSLEKGHKRYNAHAVLQTVN